MISGVGVSPCGPPGHEEADVADWLDERYAEQAPFRERQSEHWNVFRMGSEDPRHERRAPYRPGGSQARKMRHTSQRERRAMAAEDGPAECIRSLNQEWCHLEQIESCLRAFKIHKRGVQWKQGVGIYMMLCTSLLHTTTPIHCTPLPLHPTVMNSRY